jgi:enterochelin esterase-like enzyme
VSRLLQNILLITVACCPLRAFAQNAPRPAAAGGSGRGARAPTPTRDPHTQGYVTAKELPGGAIPPARQDGNFIIGATHPVAGEMTASDSVPHGGTFTLAMESSDSKFYPGIMRGPAPGEAAPPPPAGGGRAVTTHAAPYTRTVTVYVPKEYVAGTTAPFLVDADGGAAWNSDSDLFTTIDNLIAAHKVPVMFAIAIGNGGGDAKGSERGLEYDTMSGKYAEFVEQEVLPRAEKEAKVKLTKDPNGRATMGGSSGGSAALAMAWYHTDLYHRVLTYSGTYVNQQWPDNPETPHGAWEFHESLIPNNPAKPIRLWMEVGDRDLLISQDGYHDWVLANENMAKVLTARGYHYQFVFARNADHVDVGGRRQTLPEALEYVWADYAASGK